MPRFNHLYICLKCVQFCYCVICYRGRKVVYTQGLRVLLNR